MTPALLFDLDGTLVDSDADHLAAFQKVFAPYGVELDRALYARQIMGASNDLIGERFLSHLSAPERAAALDAKEAAYRDGLGALVATRGAAELLAHAESQRPALRGRHQRAARQRGLGARRHRSRASACRCW